jgi:hypothetical protein
MAEAAHTLPPVRVHVTRQADARAGLRYTLTVCSQQRPAVRVCWHGFGSPSAARRVQGLAQAAVARLLDAAQAACGGCHG